MKELVELELKKYFPNDIVYLIGEFLFIKKYDKFISDYLIIRRFENQFKDVCVSLFNKQERYNIGKYYFERLDYNINIIAVFLHSSKNLYWSLYIKPDPIKITNFLNKKNHKCIKNKKNKYIKKIPFFIKEKIMKMNKILIKMIFDFNEIKKMVKTDNDLINLTMETIIVQLNRLMFYFEDLNKIDFCFCV